LPTDAGYDRWSDIYDEEDNPLILLESDLLPPLLGDLSDLDIVDLGCGTGRQSLRMASMGARVTAVDFSEGMLAKALRKPGRGEISFLKADLGGRFPFRDQAFDRVVSCLVLDHISDTPRFFAEAKRLCRPGACIVLTVMHPAMILHGVEAHFHDPETGQEIWPASTGNQISDYVMAAASAGLLVDHMSEHVITDDLAVRSPRAGKHVGWPLLLMMVLRPA
jgi:malonyl-CoA O-methyltransferase